MCVEGSNFGVIPRLCSHGMYDEELRYNGRCLVDTASGVRVLSLN